MEKEDIFAEAKNEKIKKNKKGNFLLGILAFILALITAFVINT